MLIKWIARAHNLQDLRRFHQRQLQHRGLALGDSSTTALVAGAVVRASLEVEALANGKLACATAHKRNTTAKRVRTCHAIMKHVKRAHASVATRAKRVLACHVIDGVRDNIIISI